MPAHLRSASVFRFTGNSGSGKTTLAAQLAKALDTEFVDLDALNWEPGWTALNESDPDELERRFRAATAGERWVASGSYTRLCQRTFWPRLDTIVWLDLPLRLCAWRLIRRTWRRWRSRELLWGTNYERLWPNFMFWRKGQLAELDGDPTRPKTERHARPPDRSPVVPHPLRAAHLHPRSGDVRRRGSRALSASPSTAGQYVKRAAIRNTILVLESVLLDTGKRVVRVPGMQQRLVVAGPEPRPVHAHWIGTSVALPSSGKYRAMLTPQIEWTNSSMYPGTTMDVIGSIGTPRLR